jgi:hypothetical protein
MRTIRSRTLAAICLPLLFTMSLAAQERPPGDIGSPLLDLGGEWVPVRYSSGSLQRASQLQPAFELLARELVRGTGHRQRLPIKLLNRAEWKAAELPMSYGFPARAADATLALPAWGDSGTVSMWRKLLTRNLPTTGDAPLRSTADEAASLVPADLLGLFEASRMLLEAADFRGEERWITDVVAQTLAATVAPAIDGGSQAGAMYRRLGELEEDPLSLADYRSGISLERWLWFQAQFFNAASLILSEDRKASRELLKLARKNERRISRADLISTYPALDAWFTGSFAAPSD